MQNDVSKSAHCLWPLPALAASSVSSERSRLAEFPPPSPPFVASLCACAPPDVTAGDDGNSVVLALPPKMPRPAPPALGVVELPNLKPAAGARVRALSLALLVAVGACAEPTPNTLVPNVGALNLKPENDGVVLDALLASGSLKLNDATGVDDVTAASVLTLVGCWFLSGDFLSSCEQGTSVGHCCSSTGIEVGCNTIDMYCM